MKDQTPEMEQIDAEMRRVMQLWVKDPGNELLKRRFAELQQQYQRLYLAHTRGRVDGVA